MSCKPTTGVSLPCVWSVGIAGINFHDFIYRPFGALTLLPYVWCMQVVSLKLTMGK